MRYSVQSITVYSHVHRLTEDTQFQAVFCSPLMWIHSKCSKLYFVPHLYTDTEYVPSSMLHFVPHLCTHCAYPVPSCTLFPTYAQDTLCIPSPKLYFIPYLYTHCHSAYLVPSCTLFPTYTHTVHTLVVPSCTLFLTSGI